MPKYFKPRAEVAFELGISTQTLTRWFKKENLISENRLLSIEEQIKIYDSFGMSCIFDRIKSTFRSDIKYL